jgi:Tfp pilus assembly protein PilX
MMSIRSQRGSILIYAMLTMSAMLAIGLTLNSLFLGKLRIATAAQNSIIALSIADSAVEKCLYEARQKNDLPPMVFTNKNATYSVENIAPGAVGDITDDCKVLGVKTFQFRATGAFNGVRRSLEISQ